MSLPHILNFLPYFLYSQLFITPKQPTQDCAGKTFIVTGANVGLGKETARHFVRLNAEKVILACRSLDKGEAAQRDIETTTGRNGVVDVWSLDLGSYESVKEFAKKAEKLKRLDAIVENAGISTMQYKKLEDNEATITVNVISTFLLALLVLPKLQETAQQFNVTPNLCIVSSDVHYLTPFPERNSKSILNTLNDEKQANMTDRYNISKLLEVFACREIAKEHPVDQLKVTVNCVTPGLCHSELTREIKHPFVTVLKTLLARKTEVGSRTFVQAGLAGPETHGQFWMDGKVMQCASVVVGPEGAEVQSRVWNEIAAKLEQIEPGITKNLG